MSTLTLPQLINKLLIKLRYDYYREADEQWFRDKRAIIKAITTYGYECNQRGWLFNEEQISRELTTLFNKIANRRMEIKYLPSYLEVAIRNHIGSRAEELSQEAKRVARKAPLLIKDITGVTAVVQPSAVEMMAAIHQQGKRKKVAKSTERQEQLL